MKFNKFSKKAMAIAMSVVMLFAMAPMAFAADADVDYKINNPYAKVNFAADKAYKADLHSHTTFSDGSNPLPDMVERHYELGFDVLAITDHGTNFYGYTFQKDHYLPEMKVIGLVKNGFMDGTALNGTGTAKNGNTYNVNVSLFGDEYYSQTMADGSKGQEMLAVPFGIENNPTSFNNAHVNSWFVEYGHGYLGGTSDYATPIKAVQDLGGLSVINHPGEYTNARDEIYTADAYNKDDAVYNYKIEMFENLLLDNSTCMGIDINSKGDSRTRFDRKLWDIMLQDIVPYGRNVLAIATSDAHNLDIVDSGYTMHYLSENNVANLKANMAQGGFFAGSKYVGNYEELRVLRDELAAIDTAEAKKLYDIIDPLVKKIAEENANGEKGSKFEADKAIAAPLFTNVVVDDAADTISLSADNAAVIHWIANGKVIHVGNEIDLDDYSAQIGSYVRAEAYGEGGVMYTQAFTLEYEGAPKAPARKDFFDFGQIITKICDVPVRFLVSILPVNLIVAIAELFT